MNLLPPQEEKEILLPKTCYFNDGRSKVDYVLVYPNFEDSSRSERLLTIVNKFLFQIKNKGLIFEKETGNLYTTLTFIKVHGPHKVLTKYANVYNIGLACQNPYYKYKETIFKIFTSELTLPDPDSSVYRRAEKTLSGRRPTEITSSERSTIVYEILKRISFMHQEDEYTLKKLLDTEIFLQAYPIHDGDYKWKSEGPLSDRQLLFHFWANLKYIFREQPIHLIEKYYGPKMAFYFALVSLYTKMLIVPTVVGLITIIVGIILLEEDYSFLDEEVCSSTITLCSDQNLKTACGLMKLAYLIDNPATIIYVILCSFWGVFFWTLWQRRQAMLQLRWNLMGVKVDRTMRKEFQERAQTRKSSITGETEYYVPPSKKVATALFSYSIVCAMLFFFVLLVVVVIEYRFLLRKQFNYDEMNTANELELFTASFLTTILIMMINGMVPCFLRLYSKIVRFLTLLRMPRTQSQYNRMYFHMTFLITFINHFAALFYLAYFKGFFHRYPGNVSSFPIINKIQQDLCKPAGCLIDLGTQLITIMVIKTLVKCSKELLHHVTSRWTMKEILTSRTAQYAQWERDYAMNELDDSTVNELYTELILQYSFITFFNASLPVIGLIALIHNLVKIHHDAYRFLKLYRRPLLEKVPDIEGWNDVLKVVTFIGCMSNTFIVAFRTNFIQRLLYRRTHGSLRGYINSTLSKFAMKDFQNKDIIIDHSDEKFCFYKGLRYPPQHEKKYQPTEAFWHHLAVRAVYFIILEKLTLLLSLVLSYFIPQIPRKVKVKLEHDETLLREARELKVEEEK